MSASFIPEGYAPHLSLYQTQSAISLIKRVFQDSLARALNLKRVSAPLFVEPSSGLNDDLNGVERPVSFDIPAAQAEGQVVHSLAKWKRMALYRYDILPGKGIYTDMNAIRRDEELDNLHSIYVDQWDWEKVITEESRGKKRPEPAAAGWTCACGAVNTGKFCSECGAKRPQGAPVYQCDKCGWKPADPAHPPKFCPECGDPFDEADRK